MIENDRKPVPESEPQIARFVGAPAFEAREDVLAVEEKAFVVQNQTWMQSRGAVDLAAEEEAFLVTLIQSGGALDLAAEEAFVAL